MPVISPAQEIASATATIRNQRTSLFCIPATLPHGIRAAARGPAQQVRGERRSPRSGLPAFGRRLAAIPPITFPAPTTVTYRR
jgi:hypothetical protein